MASANDSMASAQVKLRALVEEVRRGCVRYACDGGGPIDSGGGGGSSGGGSGGGGSGGSGSGGGGDLEGDLEGDLDLERFEVACVALAKGGGGVSATEQLTNLVANPNLNLNPDSNPDPSPDPILAAILILTLTLTRWRVTRRCCTPSTASWRPACSRG